MKSKTWDLVMLFIFTTILMSGLLSHDQYNNEKYHYSTFKPDPDEMCIAIDSANNVHIVWMFYQISDGGHNMYGIWYMRLDDRGNVLIDRRHIADYFGKHPEIAVDVNDTIHIVWELGSRYTDDGERVKTGEYHIFNENMGTMDELTLDTYHDNKTAIENLEMNGYHIEVVNHTAGRPLEESHGLKGHDHSYAVDYENNTHIVGGSSGPSAFYYKKSPNGTFLIREQKLDCLPDCISRQWVRLTYFCGIPANILVLVVWVIGRNLIIRTNRKENEKKMEEERIKSKEEESKVDMKEEKEEDREKEREDDREKEREEDREKEREEDREKEREEDREKEREDDREKEKKEEN